MITSNGFEYALNDKYRTATVVNYTGSGSFPALTIPRTITPYSYNDEYLVVSIGANAFKDNTVLTTITIPNSITSIGEYAFSLTKLSSFTIRDEGTAGNAFTIGDYAFYDSKLTTITIPKSVTSIGDHAFDNCTSLTEVTIEDGNNEVSIGDYAFYNSKLTTITIPKSVTSIGNNAFDNCTSLTEVTITDGNNEVSIGNYAFQLTELTTITIPKSVTSIGDHAFEFCTSLTEVTIEDGGTVTIGNYAFKSSGLISITISNSVTSIGNNAFDNCTSLTEVNIIDGANTVTIGTGAFQSSGLTSIIIPNSVTNIGILSFYSCNNLTSVTIKDGDNEVSIGESAFQSSGLTSIIIPKCVTTIGGYAFSVQNLTSVTIEDGGALTIGENAFDSDGLTSITIPSSVTTIGEQAFRTVKYAYIQGDDTNYTDPFGSSLIAVFYDKNKPLNNSYTNKSIPFNPSPEISIVSNGLIIDSVFETNSIDLTGTYLETKIISAFVDVIVFPSEVGTGYFTITIDNIILVEKRPTPYVGSSNINKKTNKINTRTGLKIMESLLQNYTGELISIEKMDRALFTSVSSKYETIKTIFGYFPQNFDLNELDKLSKLGTENLILLPTSETPIFVGDVPLTFDGTNTRFFGKILELGNSFITNNFKITLLANGSSGITIEKIETSPICFPAGTPILTDQGYIPIDLITSQTLHNKPIQLTKTISTDKYLVCFEKDSLEKNVPFQRTIMSKDHMVYYKDFSLKAKDMIPYFDGVYKIKYKGEVLYNVLLDIHGKMKVNNMTCETLDPKHKMAKLYNRTTKEREDMIVVWKEEKKERTQMKFK